MSFLSRSLNGCILLLLLCTSAVNSQSLSEQLKQSTDNYFSSKHLLRADTLQSAAPDNQLPDPKDVMFKSMIIPGWGQITNKQIWKVPLVYGLLGGLTWYSIDLNKKYHDYRAAYYNKSDAPDDLRFGETPAYLVDETSLESLRSNRNFLRNRRDFIYITIGLAYGLNVIDAYVFAHMRSFDVSEDLSIRTEVKPSVLASGRPGFTVSMQLLKNKNAR